MSEELKQVPQHIGIIMDGNRRWAKARGKSSIEGHMEGAERIEPIVEHAGTLEVKHLTFWAFSTENWKREQSEIEALSGLFLKLLTDPMIDRLRENGVRVKTIGEIERFGPEIEEQAKIVERDSASNERIIVNFALSYGGRDEIMRATNRAIAKGITTMTEEVINDNLDTAGQPDPDLIIRTGGDMRLSGFMSWQSVYSNLHFTKTLWPDFEPEEFQQVIDIYRDPKKTKDNFGK